MMSKHIKIGDILKITSGGTPNRGNIAFFENGTIPWVKTGDLKGKYSNYPSEFITEEALKNSSAKMFPKKTVLLAMYGATIGACSILNFDAATNQACAALLPNEKVDENYLYYFLSSYKTEFIKLGVGGAQPNISAGIIKNIKIPLPPLPEQKRIADLLDAADSLRQKDKALLKKYDQLAQSLFLDMFGDPVKNEKGWEKVEMQKLCLFNKTSVKPENIKKGDKYIALDSIEKETGNIVEIYEPTENDIKSNKFKFDETFILYGKLRPYLNKVALPDFQGICSTDIIPIKPNVKLTNKYFISQLMRGNWFVDFSNERVSGANLPRISPSEIAKFDTINPPFVLQTKFAEQIQLIDKQKELAKKNLEKSEALFEALMGEMFGGKS